MDKKEITILIATKNRLTDLKYTLEKSKFLIEDQRINFVICDDGSTDGTSGFIEEHYPEFNLLRNEKSLGILACRNKMYDCVKTEYAITIDDDIHFLERFDSDLVVNYFEKNKACSVMAFRIYWGLVAPSNISHREHPMPVKSFGAGAHAMRMSDWKNIPNLPEWFVFYGEEDFMALQLLKMGKYVHYFPDIIVHHRVDLKQRKRNGKDYYVRLRRSMRAGWFLYLLFYPSRVVPRKIAYSVYSKLRYLFLKGDIKVLGVIIKVCWEILKNWRRLNGSNKLNDMEYNEYMELPSARFYWKPSEILTETLY